jgi:hypothetical protein
MKPIRLNPLANHTRHLVWFVSNCWWLSVVIWIIADRVQFLGLQRTSFEISLSLLIVGYTLDRTTIAPYKRHCRLFSRVLKEEPSINSPRVQRQLDSMLKEKAVSIQEIALIMGDDPKAYGSLLTGAVLKQRLLAFDALVKCAAYFGYKTCGDWRQYIQPYSTTSESAPIDVQFRVIR